MELGVTSIVPVQETTETHSQIQDYHNEAYHIHDNHHNMYTALKTIVLDAVNNTYIFQYINSSRDMCNHCQKTSWFIWWLDMDMLLWQTIKQGKTLQEPLEISQTIDVFIKVIDDGLWFQLCRHTVQASTSSTNGISYINIVWNLHRCLQRLVKEAEREKN